MLLCNNWICPRPSARGKCRRRTRPYGLQANNKGGVSAAVLRKIGRFSWAPCRENPVRYGVTHMSRLVLRSLAAFGRSRSPGRVFVHARVDEAHDLVRRRHGADTPTEEKAEAKPAVDRREARTSRGREIRHRLAAGRRSARPDPGRAAHQDQPTSRPSSRTSPRSQRRASLRPPNRSVAKFATAWSPTATARSTRPTSCAAARSPPPRRPRRPRRSPRLRFRKRRTKKSPSKGSEALGSCQAQLPRRHQGHKLHEVDICARRRAIHIFVQLGALCLCVDSADGARTQ